MPYSTFSHIGYSSALNKNVQTVLGVPVDHGEPHLLPSHVKTWLEESVAMCQPDRLHIMDGTDKEDKMIKVGGSFWAYRFSCSII